MMKLAIPLLFIATTASAEDIRRIQPTDDRICARNETIDVVRCTAATLIGCEGRGEEKNYTCEDGVPKQTAQTHVRVVEKKVIIPSRPKVIVVHDKGVKHPRPERYRYPPRVRSIFDMLFHHGAKVEKSK